MSPLRRVVVIIVVVWLLGGALVLPTYNRIAEVVTAPYQVTFQQARDNTNDVSRDVSAIAQDMRTAEQAGTPVSASDRLALAQARLAIDANAFAAINYALAGYSLFVGLWVGLLGLALALAIAIAS
jgi:hypothetical protein